MKAILAAFVGVLALVPPALADPAMWEVRDADSAIRLFGSMHMLPADLRWRTPMLDEAMAKADQVYFETDVGPRGFLALTVRMTVASFQAVGTPWLQLLDPDQSKQLAAAIEPLGMTLAEAGATPPWVLSMQLAGHQLSSADAGPSGYSFTSGVEWILQWDLVPDRKAYLETPGEQFDLMAAGTLEQQVEALMALLNEAGGGDSLGMITRAWAGGDVAALAESFAAQNEVEQAGIDALLLNRNRNWIPTLEQLLADNREDLIVVGAAHLAGDGSVLDLLEKAGYTVTRIQ